MKTMDMKAAHVDLISQLRLSKDGLSAMELSELCQIDKGQVSRTVKDLENRGFVKSSYKKGKRTYGSKITLTSQGEKYADMVNERIDHIVEKASATLTEKERIKFYEVLMEIAKNLNQIATVEG